jgi:putative ABC transport system permease protein
MLQLFSAILSQVIPFLPLAVGISTSFTLLRATDLSLDGSFVLGAAIFAKLLMLGVSPILACFIALFGGALVGCFVSFVQKGGRIDPLLAGVLVVFILTSLNLIIMGRPNISLLSAQTLFSSSFAKSATMGWAAVTLFCVCFLILSFVALQSRLGLLMRALGDNPDLLQRLGYPSEGIRTAGFALTNMLAAASGIVTAQVYGYADIGMGLGVTLTGICAILLGQQFMKSLFHNPVTRNKSEFVACFLGVCFYFAGVNILLRLDIDPIYLKMALGLVLIFFLRSVSSSHASKAKSLT